MKTLITLLSFIIGMMMNAQVVQNQVFSTTEEISFVSDDGGGKYTVSGPGSGSDGFLAIYDENMPTNSRWEVKNFPPRTDLGSVHDAEVTNAVLIDGTTYAVGKVANSATTTWYAIRKYAENNPSYSSSERIAEDIFIKLYKNTNELYAVIGIYNDSDLLSTGWNLPGEGMYLVKFNRQDLSLDWSYRVCSTWNNTEWRIQTQDNLISTNIAYRYAIQSLPNGNIAVTVSRGLSGNPGGEFQLWEFDPATGQKLGVIDDSYTDYDRDGTEGLQYQFHRWKVVDGVLFHEFWQDPNNSQDAQVGHWEKLEVPGWTPGGSSNPSTGGGWDSADLVVTAVSDAGYWDTYNSILQDFHIDQYGRVVGYGRWLSPSMEAIKKEHFVVGEHISDSRDRWYRENGDLMVMGLHSLYKITIGEQYPGEILLNSSGNGVVEARNNQLYYNGWKDVKGEGSLVVTTLPNVGSQPDTSWWVIPSGYTSDPSNGHSQIIESHRPGEVGRRYFYVYMQPSGGFDAETTIRVTLYLQSQVSVPETEISGLSLYPNPVESFLTVEADVDVDGVRVYNMSGIMVKEASGNARVFMGDLPAGVYVVEVTAADKVSRRKVIKK